MISSKEVMEMLSWEDIQKIMHHMAADEKKTSPLLTLFNFIFIKILNFFIAIHNVAL